MSDVKLTLAERAKFSPERMGKVTLFESARLMLGLNCLEEGQSQKSHAHEDSDKFYFVVSGRAKFVVGATAVEAGAGELVLCPAGQAHGIERALERTIILMGIAPWQVKEP